MVVKIMIRLFFWNILHPMDTLITESRINIGICNDSTTVNILVDELGAWYF